MPDVHLEVRIPLPQVQAFDTFVGQMNVWWPRQGVFPFSFAPKSTRPLSIQFEPQMGGRYFETFADGSEYTIGHIKLWEPSSSLAYSWRDPAWPGATTISLHFSSSGAGTRVVYEQDGFAEAGVPDLTAYYQIGCRQMLAGYVAHCVAMYELSQLG